MRILIVDDEHHAVNYLSALIEDHADAGLEVCKAYSGLEALESMAKMKIDLILLDIHMPGLSGLEVAKRTVQSWPKCRIIFLTAYSNFEHIYEGSRHEHSKYLLKTESDETILKEVFTAVQAIREENEGLHILKDARQKSLLLTHLLQQNILRELLLGHNIARLRHELWLAGSSFSFDLQKPVYLMYMQAYFSSMEEYETNLSSWCLKYLQLMEEYLCRRFSFSMLDLGNGSMLWFFQPSKASPETAPTAFTFLKEMSSDFSEYCVEIFHRLTSIILFDEAVEWKKVSDTYHRLQTYAETSAMDMKKRQAAVTILRASDTGQLQTADDAASMKKEFQELALYLNQGSQAEYIKVLNRLKENCVSIRSMHSIRAIKIYNTISLMLLDYIDLFSLQEKLVSHIAIYPLYYILDFSDWSSAFQYLESMSKHLFSILDTKKEDKNEQVVSRIKAYIDGHLDESLTLTSLAGIVNYNATYVSRLFKQATGMGLSEYICQSRLCRAKYLLTATDESIQAIAASTGFDSSGYFSVVFKKHEGLSPSEYLRKYRKI